MFGPIAESSLRSELQEQTLAHRSQQVPSAVRGALHRDPDLSDQGMGQL